MEELRELYADSGGDIKGEEEREVEVEMEMKRGSGAKLMLSEDCEGRGTKNITKII